MLEDDAFSWVLSICIAMTLGDWLLCLIALLGIIFATPFNIQGLLPLSPPPSVGLPRWPFSLEGFKKKNDQ